MSRLSRTSRLPGRQPGFTLAELLIALVILGMIATFTIPKLLQNQQNSKNTSILKEDIATINQVLYQGMLKGEISHNSSDNELRTYFLNRINGVRICDHESVDGCCTGGMLECGSEAAVMMHNGSVIYSINLESWNDSLSVMIDTNGPAGPNLEGQDVLMIMPVIGPGTVDGFKPGTVGYWSSWPSDGTSSQTLFNSLF